MSLIIHGATGAQGAPVVAALLAQGLSPRAAVRDASAYAGPTAPIAVDLSSVDSLVAAYTGADAVFVHLPIGSAEAQQRHAEVIVEAVRRAQPSRVIASTSGYPFGVPGAEGSPVDTLVNGLRSTGVSLAIVSPKLYLENLLLPVVTSGVDAEGILRYPIRDDYAISWSSHLDVADVVVRLIQDVGVTGVVGVGALPGLLGSDLAAGFAAHFGADIAFESQTPDDFGAAIIPLFGEAGAAPVVDSYRWRATQPNEVIEESTSAQTQLGLAPRTVAAWLEDVSV
ncbi:SDR family oxidoreductase [Herbiconiux liukaitaii]|uniref:SDR family oxidoreductase n=1 Tax=Herbiconiux liukaitaii TaxID=3342799 RepID=UPI0035B8EA22